MFSASAESLTNSEADVLRWPLVSSSCRNVGLREEFSVLWSLRWCWNNKSCCSKHGAHWTQGYTLGNWWNLSCSKSTFNLLNDLWHIWQMWGLGLPVLINLGSCDSITSEPLSGSFSPEEYLACSKAAYVEGNPSKMGLAENLFWLRDVGRFLSKFSFSKFGFPGSRVGESKFEDRKSLKSLRKLIESAVRISLTNNKTIKIR